MNIRIRHLLLLFIPALLVVGLALAIHLTGLWQEQSGGVADTAQLVPIFAEDPIVGNKKAPTTIVAFEDFGCNGCKEQAFILEELIQAHPNAVKVVWKPVNATRFPYSTNTAHEYAYCANKQGQFTAFASLAFANSANLSPEIVQTIAQQVSLNEKKLSDCLDSGSATAYLSRVEQIATSLNIQQVPALFVDGIQVSPTPQSRHEWEQVLGL